MATDEEMAAFVERAADMFDAAETALKAARKAASMLPPLMDEGRRLGLAGYLQSSRMKADLLAAAGVVASAESMVFGIHAEGTKLAEARGVDLPQPRDGGGGR